MSGVAIVGAGYAGLACGVELARRGVGVTVYELSRSPGGRARAVEAQGRALDNGQHILIGAYREMLRLMALVGADADEGLLRLPLTLRFPGQLDLRAPRLPAPLHMLWAILGARGLSLAERLAMVRFMRSLAVRDFLLAADTTVEALLQDLAQPLRVRRLLWEPLCVAALNTPPSRASAQVFANVLRDSLAARRGDSDLLLPRVDLQRLFPAPALAYLAARGSNCVLGTPVRQIHPEPDGGFSLDTSRGLQGHRRVVVATAPYHAAALLPAAAELDDLREQLAGLEYEPIVTCYLQYDPPVRLEAPMVGMADGITQWLFDRGRLGGAPGLLAAVISARGKHQELDRDALAAQVHREIAALLPDLSPPRWSRVITEKRATFSCRPDLARPGTRSALAGLYLCGDYVESDYPATLESAVRSGVAAAQAIAADGG